MSEIPQKIGPYRVLQRLGAGGMGEVLLAHDERLDRRVAVKRIRPDAKISPDQRERFRREARVAARLNHSAIVQVYDILEEGDVEHIVMEYVEGTSLRDLASQGPLDLALALRLAREIAGGLDAAHREGVVHRDLKTENVLVTRTGHAKISDFGIAKRLLAGPPEPDLTGADMVVGTYRVMSPEQARGEAVDHRSDLFSFGVLLYEILTGRSPFVAENALATLSRILSSAPVPVRTLRPEVPEEISSLIGQLLQKDPILRPRSAGEVRWHLEALLAPGTAAETAETLVERSPLVPSGVRSTPLQPSAGPAAPADSALTTLKPRPRRRTLLAAGVLLLTGLASAGAWLAFRPPAPPLYVAVLAPEIGTGGDSGEVELLASGIRVALLQALVDLEGVSPKVSEDVDAVSGPPRQIATAVSADELVSSRLDCRLESCRVSLGRLRGSDGSVLWAESFEVPIDDYYLVARAVATQIRRGYPDQRLRPGAAESAVSSSDFAEFLRLRQRYDSRRDASLDPILAGLAAIRGRSPRFLQAYLLEAQVARYKFFETRRAADLERAFDLVQQARRLAPGDPQPLFVLFSIALDGGRLETAEEALDELERLTPGDAAVQERRAQLLDARGRSDEALALLRSVVRQRPSWKRLYKLAALEYSRGESAAARQHLNELLRRSPGNLDGLSLLAQIELTSGDARRAVELYSEIVRRAPGLTEMGNLGLAYFLLGRYGEASGIFRRIASEAPDNPLAVLNLADSLLLMGRREEATELYRRILVLIEKDPSAASAPQLLTVKAQALAHLNQGPAAVAALQEALQRAPDNAQVAYEASLVYALLREESSAVVNARRALELGYEPRWFSFPWFSSLRARPEFAALFPRE
jgi:eukaryotic-like serine/threonine-protein kinase